MIMQYYEVPKLEKSAILRKLNSNTSGEIIQAIVSICKEGDDYNFALDVIEKYATYPDNEVRAITLDSIQFIAMNYERLNLKRAVAVLKHALKDKSKRVTSAAEESIENLALMFPEFHHDMRRQLGKFANEPRFKYLWDKTR
jgi:hypothetical protein